ncbi:condensation domain-containing protein, partial [Aquimarina spongiae]
SDLRSYLQDRLPDYMIPSYFKELDILPMTPNGKIDRKSLPDFEIEASSSYQAPSTATEERLVSIWSEVLKLDTSIIGTATSFFELGGNSIRAVHVINLIEKEFNIKIPIKLIFEHTTIKSLSIKIMNFKTSTREEIPKIKLKANDKYITSSAQERMFYKYLQNTDSLAYNISGAYKISGVLDVPKIKETLEKLVDRHAVLRANFALSNIGVLQTINTTKKVSLTILEMDKYAHLDNVYLDFVKPFDLESELPIRFALLPVDENTNILFVDVHHIVCDGISLNILMNDFKELYQNKASVAPDFNYIDYSYWQNNLASNLTNQKEYWLHQLSGDLPVLTLPISGSKESADITIADFKTLGITDQDYKDIKRFLVQSDVSEFMFFISIFYILLQKLSDNSDIIIGTDVIGRTHPRFQDVIGTFINILPLRSNVDTETSYQIFLDDIKENVLNAFENQEYQFDEMISELSKKQEVVSEDLVSVHFAFVNYFEGEKEFFIEDLKFESLHLIKDETTQYEFKIEVSEHQSEYAVKFIYSKELYDSDIIQVFTEYYYNIIKSVLHDPSVLIGQIEV